MALKTPFVEAKAVLKTPPKASLKSQKYPIEAQTD
jgi:hypothetical protein